MIDLAVREMTAAVMMTEAEEEMTGEILDEIIVETSQETTDVAMTGITGLEDMTAEILMETMIGIVQNAIIPTLLEEWNVTDVVLQSQVVETLALGILTVEILVEGTSETGILTVEILVEGTSETGIQTVEILVEVTSETGIQTVEILVEVTSETEIQEIIGHMAEKTKPLLIMIGLAKSVTILIFHLEKNVIVVESQRVVTLMEETTEVDVTIGQEIIRQIVMLVNQENLGRQRGNLRTMPTIEGQNRSMPVLEEEIAMIK